MVRSVDAAKRRAWSERLQRFVRCDQTVAAFCIAEGVSLPSFYQWCRKLGFRRANRRLRKSRTPRQAFLPVQLVSPMSAGAPIEIHLPNGARVCLASGDPSWLAAAIAAAGQLPGPAGQHGAARPEGAAC